MLILVTATVAAALLQGEATSPAADKPAVVECPLGVETRIIFPEAVVELRTPPAPVVRALRLRVVAAAPRAIITFTPSSHPIEAAIGFEGPTAKLQVQIRTTATGKAQEVRLGATTSAELARAPSPTPPVARASLGKEPPRGGSRVPTVPTSTLAPSTSLPTPPPAKEGSAIVTPRPGSLAALSAWSSPPPPPLAAVVAPLAPAAERPALTATAPTTDPSLDPATASFDASVLALATAQRIGREEGLPGQKVVVLEDALRSKALVWLRFRVPNGAKAHLDGVRWERGEIKSLLVEPDGRDLRVVVQLPRSGVTKRTRVELRLDGQAYKFAVSAPWFSSFLRSLF